MVVARTKTGSSSSTRADDAKPGAAAGGYERGHGAPFSPASDESSGRQSPAVTEARRRADGSNSANAEGGSGNTGTVDAPKAPETTRGKTDAQRKSTSAASAGQRAGRARNPDPSR